MPRIHLVNPSTQSFGVAVITPRWLYVLAAATGRRWGDPQIVDETLEAIDFDAVSAGDVVRCENSADVGSPTMRRD